MSIRFASEDLDESFDQGLDDSQDEMADEVPRIQPRHPRASLTHHAIKSELMKMNKQKEGQRAGEFAHEPEEDHLSRSARKRKRRREKVLEERRASGRSEDFDEDFANFKSVSIARRRSSVLPANAVFHHHQDSVGCATYPSKGSCWSTIKSILWWIAVISIVTGLAIYVWPLMIADDIDVQTTSGVSTNQEVADHAANVLPQAADPLIQDNDATSTGQSVPDTVSDSESIGAIWLLLQTATDTFNSLLLDRDAALGNPMDEQLAVDQDSQPDVNQDESSASSSYFSWWTSSDPDEHVAQPDNPIDNPSIDELGSEQQPEDQSDNQADNEQAEDQRVPIELDLQSAWNGQHIDESTTPVDERSRADMPVDEIADQDTPLDPQQSSFGWFWSASDVEAQLNDDQVQQETDPESPSQFEVKPEVEPETDLETNQAHDHIHIHTSDGDFDEQMHLTLQQMNLHREQLREEAAFDEQQAHQLVDEMIEKEQQLQARIALKPEPGEPEMFECDYDHDPLLEMPEECNQRQLESSAATQVNQHPSSEASSTYATASKPQQSEQPQQPQQPQPQPQLSDVQQAHSQLNQEDDDTQFIDTSNQNSHLSTNDQNAFYEYDDFLNF